ncbi:hypothetical protein FRC06_008886 [Ceratobasidium sp. 370]|nr:hypothetical protein FRC06_008886 [Ceratobasidium sp. 370]
MSSSQTIPRANVKVGQKLWVKVVIDPKALIKPTGRLSHTMRDIFNGKPVYKQCYVLRVTPTHLEVAFTTTFGASASLSTHVTNPKAWYPIAPAPANTFAPLPAPANQVSPVACWVYLLQTIFVTEDHVSVLGDAAIPTDSVSNIVAAMSKKK